MKNILFLAIILFPSLARSEEGGEGPVNKIVAVNAINARGKDSDQTSRCQPITFRVLLQSTDLSLSPAVAPDDIIFSAIDSDGNPVSTQVTYAGQDTTKNGKKLSYQVTVQSAVLEVDEQKAIKSKVLELLVKGDYPKDKLKIIEEMEASNLFLLVPITLNKVGTYKFSVKIKKGDVFKDPVTITVSDDGDVGDLIYKRLIGEKAPKP